MYPRLVSTVFIVLGCAALAVQNFVLAPRRPHQDTPCVPAAEAVSSPLGAAPPPPPSAGVEAPPPKPVGDVLFPFEAQRLHSDTFSAELHRVALTLRADPSQRLLLRGHADRFGTPEGNVELSRRRAEAIERLLVGYGAPADRIDLEAIGDAEPADTADTPAAWAKNRRVQVLWK